jgi:hypothetical protein
MPPKTADVEDPRITVGVRALRDAGLELSRLELVQLLVACDYNPTVAAVVAIQRRQAAAPRSHLATTTTTTGQQHADPCADVGPTALDVPSADPSAAAVALDEYDAEAGMMEWRFDSNGAGGGSVTGGSRSADYAEFQQQDQGPGNVPPARHKSASAAESAATAQQRADSASIFVDQPLQQQKYHRTGRSGETRGPALRAAAAAADDDEDDNANGTAQWLQPTGHRLGDGGIGTRQKCAARDDDDDGGDSDDGDHRGDDDRHVGYATAAAGFAGIFMTSMVHGGFHVRGDAADVVGQQPADTWLNEGICIVRLDDDRQATHTTTIELVDLTALSREDFEARLASWRDDDYTELAADLGDAMEAPEGFTIADEHRRFDELRAAHQRRALMRRREEAYAAAFEEAMQNGKDVLAAMGIVDILRAKDKVADLALAGAAARGGSDDEDDEHATGAASVRGTGKSKKKVVVEGSSSDEDIDEDKPLTALDKMRLKAAKEKRKADAKEQERIARERKEQLMQRRNARLSEYTSKTTAEDLEKTYKIRMRLPTYCTVLAIRHIDNPPLKRRFDLFCAELKKEQGVDPNVQLAFHGTSNQAVDAIADTGFKAPLDNPRLQHSSGNDGWYGNGIYLAPDPNTSFWYARGDRMLVCLVAMGKIYRCPGMMMGAHLQPGYTSHTSPGGNELVAYKSSQVLPIAIIIFDRQQAAPSCTAVTSVVTATSVVSTTSKHTREALDLKRLGAGSHVSNSVRKAVNRENREAWRARKK